DAEYVLLRYERLVATGRRPYLRPLMRELGHELRELLAEVFARSGRPVTEEQLERYIALVDGAVVNALIEADPEPRAVAGRLLTAALREEGHRGLGRSRSSCRTTTAQPSGTRCAARPPAG